jgi:hypothetical protein
VSLRDLEAFASLDWGYAAPGCVLWWVCLPDGHLHIAQEYKFQQSAVETVGHQIHERTRYLGVKLLRYVVADPACWQKTGHGRGEAIAETLLRLRLPMRRGDNDRRNGWQRLHELLQESPDGTPWLTVDPGCAYLCRTIPSAVSDKNDPEDVDTHGDDHALDALRYGAMSRPAPTRFHVEHKAPGAVGRLFDTLRSEAANA